MDEQESQKATRQAIACFEAGDVKQGLELFREAVRLAPRSFETHLNLGSALNRAGLWSEANAALADAHALAPGEADIHRAIADSFAGMGKADELAARYRLALAERPGDLMLKRNAAAVLFKLGRLPEAARLAREAAAGMPKDAEAGLTLASALTAEGRLEEAEQALIALLAATPRNAQAGHQLGLIRLQRGFAESAAATFETVLRLAPDHADAMLALARTKRVMGQTSEAMLLLKRALALRPNSPEARRDAASALADRGSIDAAVARYRAEIAKAPDSAMLSDLAYLLSLQPRATRAEILETHVECGRRHGSFPAPPHANGRDPDRRLKIGYVSPDFREHSVAYFLEPLLQAHDRRVVEVFSYPSGLAFDATTERLRAASDHWRPLGECSDAEAFARIRQDGIDVLVDLAGHTAGNRLGVFAHAPAPVQITWLGYPETTGVAAIGYRITDGIVSPPDADRFATERLLRLPHGFHCYRAPPAAPEVSELPCLKAGYVTFGSFSGPQKLNPELIAMWAAVLRAAPDARIAIKCREFADEATRDKYAAMFGAAGIASERLSLLERSPTTAAHLAQYAAVDICLDTFPYNGTTTICEALWMGVPVVTRVGERAASRVGASLLTEAGLADLVAKDAEEFAAIAAALARDRERLQALREAMRARLDASHLRDEAGFARAIEGAYREAWRRWCDNS